MGAPGSLEALVGLELHSAPFCPAPQDARAQVSPTLSSQCRAPPWAQSKDQLNLQGCEPGKPLLSVHYLPWWRIDSHGLSVPQYLPSGVSSCDCCECCYHKHSCLSFVWAYVFISLRFSPENGLLGSHEGALSTLRGRARLLHCACTTSHSSAVHSGSRVPRASPRFAII